MDVDEKGDPEIADESEVQPLEKIVASVITEAREQPGSDADLLDILQEHIVTELPHARAVKRALKDIADLAEARVMSAKIVSDDEEPPPRED